jgi:hypothetical protein
MRQFDAKEFFKLTGLIHGLSLGYKFTPSLMKDEGILEALNDLEILCSSSWLNSSAAQIKRIKNLIIGRDHGPDEVYHSMLNLMSRLTDDVATLILMQLEPDRLQYYDALDLFGEAVSAKFPDAVSDIREAGNCFATGRHTACVFHLMRVLEKGLFALAKSLRIKTLKTFNYENWQNIIDQIESKIREAEKSPRSPKKTENLKRLGDAAKEFRYIKNAWRNHVMHSRVSYNESEAESILRHVGEFIKALAK